ncbi:MAG: tetratricopeptide repeat protein [Chitinophagaceae bacterium]
MKHFFSICLLLLCTLVGFSQEQLLNVAKQYLNQGDFEKAGATYKQLFEYQPDNVSILHDYIKCLIALKDFKTAESILKSKIKKDKKNSDYIYALAKVYQAQQDTKKANDYINKYVDNIDLKNQEDVKKVGSILEKDAFYTQAIALYEKAKNKSDLPDKQFLFAEELALLFTQTGNENQAIESLLDMYASKPEKAENVKSTLQRIADNPQKFQQLKTRLEGRIAKEEENFAYPDLMSWLYIQQDDYHNAFRIIKTIDKRLTELGRRVLGFARVCLREQKYVEAIEAYDYIIELGDSNPYYLTAGNEKLTTLKKQLQYKPDRNAQDISQVVQAYLTFLDKNPSYKSKETIREYADLEARYANNIEHAIDALAPIANANNVDRAFRGRCKLELGDYELIRGNIWESTLLYSQVDKEFKQDMLGEEARFKNAKLSYYTGDFEWAQGQLDVLKASTSELIANDALNLSVLLVENNPPADSNTTPLLMYARADLLAFQNKDKEALEVLDSIALEFPKHPLQDDILMQRAKIALKKMDYGEVGLQLQKIISNYGDDILADDAMFNLAIINEEHYQNKEEAKRLYQELIVKYPGSTFVNEARKRFRILRGDKPDIEQSKTF